MRKITQYQIICCTALDDAQCCGMIEPGLPYHVNELIKLGWQPYGFILKEDNLYYQAMVKYEEEDTKNVD